PLTPRRYPSRPGTPPPRGGPRSFPRSRPLASFSVLPALASPPVASRSAQYFGRMDYERQRDEMVRDLRRMGIRDERVLAAMRRVPRERFVREGDRDIAYGDHALGIAEAQTISQPYVVARMTELLEVVETHHVLEVG